MKSPSIARHTHTGLNTQKGISLISLMIGMLISLLCILGGFTLYKDLVHVTAESKIDTQHDGRLATTMQTIQQAIYSAGYGFANADLNHLVVDYDNTTKVLQLLWRHTNANNSIYFCEGIKESTFTDPSDATLQYREIKKIAANNCDAASALTGLNWNQEQIISRWQIIDGQPLKTFLTANNTLLNISITQASCAPYGAIAAAMHQNVAISAPNSAVLNGAATIAQNTFNYCLPNFTVAGP